MSEQHEFVIWRTEGDYDALEPFLSGARVNYKRSKLTQFSVDPTHATIITVTCVAIRSLALVLTAYIKERRRRIVVARPYGTKLAADNYSADEVERVLRSSAESSDRHIYIEPPTDKPNDQ